MVFCRWRLACLLLAASLACCSAAPSAPDFTLRDDANAHWQLSAHRGDSILLAFGYTHCADTCPALVARLERATTTLGSLAQRVKIAIVTVDPARDTPLQMHRFLSRLRDQNGSQIVGLTGSAAQIVAVERAYHVWSQRMPGRRGRYDVAHSSIVFVIDPRGAIAGTRDDDDSQTALLAALEPTLR
jgi:protein SCO1/2